MDKRVEQPVTSGLICCISVTGKTQVKHVSNVGSRLI